MGMRRPPLELRYHQSRGQEGPAWTGGGREERDRRNRLRAGVGARPPSWLLIEAPITHDVLPAWRRLREAAARVGRQTGKQTRRGIATIPDSGLLDTAV